MSQPKPQDHGVAGIVLAAGGSTRFGGCKQLAILAGQPVLAHALRAMSEASLARVVVVLGCEQETILERVDLHGAEPISCPDWRGGQGRSLSAGLNAIGDATAAVVTLGDQPRISPRAIEAVIAARRPGLRAVRACYAGVPGHPVLLERALFGRLRDRVGDSGARAIVAAVPHVDLACDGIGDPADVDTPDDLWRLESAAGLDAARPG